MCVADTGLTTETFRKLSLTRENELTAFRGEVRSSEIMAEKYSDLQETLGSNRSLGLQKASPAASDSFFGACPRKRQLVFPAFFPLIVALVTITGSASAGISLRSLTTGGNNGSALSSLTIGVPAGLQPGDILIAQIAVRLPPRASLIAPTGWTLVRRDQSLGQQQVVSAIYYRVVPSCGEQASDYTWTFPTGNNAVGGIAAYSGADRGHPIDASSGEGDPAADASAVDAPSLLVPAGHYGDLLLCAYTVADGSPITLPAGIQQRWSMHPPSYGVYAAMGDVQLNAAVTTPVKIAFASAPRPNVGEQVALKAASVSVWPMSGHDPQRTGQSPVNTGADTGKLKWLSAGHPFLSSAIAADGTVYLDGQDNSLTAFAPDGTQKWQFTGSLETLDSFAEPEVLADPLTTSPVVGPDCTIYAGSGFGNLYAVLPNGVEKWRVDAEPPYNDPFNLQPAYATDPNDGTEKWRFTTGGGIVATGVGTDGTIYLCSQDASSEGLGNSRVAASDKAGRTYSPNSRNQPL
jgi:hypothetical protein